MTKIHITARQLKEALEFAAPDGADEQLDTELVLGTVVSVKADDGSTEVHALAIWLADYPDEGVLSLDPIVAA